MKNLKVRLHKQMAEVNGISYSPYNSYSPPSHAVYANSYESVYTASYANTAGYTAAAAPVSYPSIQGQGYSIAQQVIINISFISILFLTLRLYSLR